MVGNGPLLTDEFSRLPLCRSQPCGQLLSGAHELSFNFGYPSTSRSRSFRVLHVVLQAVWIVVGGHVILQCRGCEFALRDLSAILADSDGRFFETTSRPPTRSADLW